ncbi:MAG: hypothetical protein ACRDYY_01430 [Acidimicrobiales bacterium]
MDRATAPVALAAAKPRRRDRNGRFVSLKAGTSETGGFAPPGNGTSGHSGADYRRAPVQGQGRVVLSIGSGYFHDGKVAADRYAKDLPAAYTAALAAARVLLNGIFAEHVPEPKTITSRCDRWEVRFGPGAAQVEVVEHADEGRREASPAAPDRHLAPWRHGLAADREADHATALSAFARDAEAAVAAGSPQRAAVAYRSAASAARGAGRSDEANRLMRLAGKAYLEIAEAPETTDQGVFMAYREAARCLLDAGNLPLAHGTLDKALAIGRALGYTEAG